MSAILHMPYGPAWWNEPAPVIDAREAADFITRGFANQPFRRGPRCDIDCAVDHQYVLIQKRTDKIGDVIFFSLDARGIYGCDARLHHQQRPLLTRIEVYRDYVDTVDTREYGDSVEYLCPLLDEIASIDEVPL